MKTLLVGASGFLGKNLLASGALAGDVTALYRSSDFPNWLAAHAPNTCQAVQVDLCHEESVTKALAQTGKHFDHMVYLAANSDPTWSAKHPKEDWDINVSGLVRLLRGVETPRFMFFSSGAVYDGHAGKVGGESFPFRSHLPYAVSKYAAERYIREWQQAGHIGSYNVVRFFGAFGPFEPERKIYGRLVRQFAKDKNPSFTLRGDGQNLIDAMYITDTVTAIKQILEGWQDNKTFDLASGAPISLADLVTRTGRLFLGEDPHIDFTGETAEYIEFLADTKDQELLYGIKPSVALEDGLTAFARHLGFVK